MIFFKTGSYLANLKKKLVLCLTVHTCGTRVTRLGHNDLLSPQVQDQPGKFSETPPPISNKQTKLLVIIKWNEVFNALSTGHFVFELISKCTRDNSSSWEAKADWSLWVQGQTGPNREFHACQGHIVRPFLKKTKNKLIKIALWNFLFLVTHCLSNRLEPRIQSPVLQGGEGQFYF